MLGRSFPSTVRGMSTLVAITAALMLGAIIRTASAGQREAQICDIAADTALGLENYPVAAALHQNFLRLHPNDSLAHYHLGFAYRMMGREVDEIREYGRAVALGLRQWDLFLDLGLAYLEQRDYLNAMVSLRASTMLGSEHAEARFNLGIAYENVHRLSDAMREIIIALRMAPADPDMRNTKAVICAEAGDLACARDEWTLLREIFPTYAPAQMNLAILTGSPPELRRSSADTVETAQLVAVKDRSNGKR